ncbi:MAG: HNH endonuclease [Deltaproteobacteria bacterium]|nr:HNH endonuclease [Deltaproteobacteria bacterium]
MVEYRHARPTLLERMGGYCSFCEVQAPTLDVEHIRCKDHNPALALEWSNFLLACKNCNSTKGTTVSTDEDVAARLWPDRDRTQDAFVYGEGGVVSVAPLVDPAERRKAELTAEMVGLLRRPGAGLTSGQTRTASDRRLHLRRQAWDEATISRNNLRKAPVEEMRDQILILATARGFFSVWLTVFRDDADMVDRLIRAFSGTDRARILTPPPTAPPPPHPTPPPPPA